jgi:chemotaxis protein methyltransferase CheR
VADPMLLMRPSRMPLGFAGFEYVRELVKRNSAIVLDQSKDYLIEARLAPLAESEGLSSVDALIAVLRQQNPGKIHGRVVEALTTNETHFFRDIQPFRILAKQVLSELQERNKQNKRMRFWSAACSTGQEPYSIAMTLKNEMPDLATWDVKIIGSDLNETVLASASAGAFRQLDVNRGLAARDLIRHFDRTGATWRVKQDIRNLCSFQKMNLVTPWPIMPLYDVIFLRNVLIYFEASTKADVLERIAKALRPSGFLFLGAAETTFGLSDKFERAFDGPGGCYQLIRKK